MCRELQEKIDALTHEIESMVPNMKAIERYDNVQNDLKSSSGDLESARQQTREIATRFEQVKKQR